MTLTRRVRGGIGMGLVWAAGWSLAGGVAVELSLPAFAISGGAIGLVAGILFVRGASYSLLALVGIPATLLVASAVSAAGTLLMARRAPAPQLEAVDGTPQLERHSAAPR